MRLAVLTPRMHFHGPIVVRRLARARVASAIRVYATPKLSGPHGRGRTPVARLRHLVRESGWDYLLSMSATAGGVSLLRRAERLGGVRPGRARFPSLADVVREAGLEEVRIRRVTGDGFAASLRAFAPDVLLAVFFNQIVPPEVLRIPRRAALNLHPSLLPAYRGISPCFWVLARGETVTGVTVHRLAEGIDDGEILAQTPVAIRERDTVFTVYRRCAEAGAGLLVKLLREGVPDPRHAAGRTRSPEARPAGLPLCRRITPEAVRALRRRRRRFAFGP